MTTLLAILAGLLAIVTGFFIKQRGTISSLEQDASINKSDKENAVLEQKGKDNAVDLSKAESDKAALEKEHVEPKASPSIAELLEYFNKK